jgi:hypothetical protein
MSSPQPTDAQRIAFANGLAWLHLRHVKDLKPEHRKFIEAVRDAKTVDEMRNTYADAAVYAYAATHAAAAYAAYASAAYASAAYAYAAATHAAYAQEHAIKAGVPEHEVAALRMTCLGE